MEVKMSLSLILAQRIIDLFDEAGATTAERYRAVSLATVLIPDSVKEDATPSSSNSRQSGEE
jgi:hypothetical protein